jgi:hypothetical protein
MPEDRDLFPREESEDPDLDSLLADLPELTRDRVRGLLSRKLNDIADTYQWLLRRQEEPELTEERRGIPVLNFLALDIPPQEQLLAPWLPCAGSAMIYSPPGKGKTWVALSAAWAVATARGFLGFKAEKPRGVIYVDGEMHPWQLQERLGRIRKGLGGELQAPFVMLSGKHTPGGIPDLASRQGRAFVERELFEGIDLLVLDNLSCLVHSGAENEAESFAKIRAWVNDLNSRGIAVLLLHHAGKSGDQRGSSAKVDGIDTLMALKPVDDKPGVKVEVRWEKWRGAPEGGEPFDARMTLDNFGGVSWERLTSGSLAAGLTPSASSPRSDKVSGRPAGGSKYDD